MTHWCTFWMVPWMANLGAPPVSGTAQEAGGILSSIFCWVKSRDTIVWASQVKPILLGLTEAGVLPHCLSTCSGILDKGLLLHRCKRNRLLAKTQIWIPLCGQTDRRQQSFPACDKKLQKKEKKEKQTQYTKATGGQSVVAHNIEEIHEGLHYRMNGKCIFIIMPSPYSQENIHEREKEKGVP